MPKDILKVVIIGDGGVGKVKFIWRINSCAIVLGNANTTFSFRLLDLFAQSGKHVQLS